MSTVFFKSYGYFILFFLNIAFQIPGPPTQISAALDFHTAVQTLCRSLPYAHTHGFHPLPSVFALFCNFKNPYHYGDFIVLALSPV